MDDKEYAISFEAGSGLDEVNSGCETLGAAKKVALGYQKDGAKNITIKYYRDGDLLHQWYLVGNKWKQYE